MTNDDFYDYVRRSAGRDIADDESAGLHLLPGPDPPATKLQMVRTQRERDSGPMPSPTSTTWFFPFVRDVLFTQEGLQLDDYFEKAYLSYEMHELKPSPEIYRKMIEKSGMRPEATLFIDDNAENLHTAQELGFHVYMPRPREDFRFLFDDGPGR